MTGRYVANLGVVAHEAFEEETVLIQFERGTYFSLRGSAQEIWAMIQSPAALDDVLAVLAERHGTLPPEAPDAVTAMLERLCVEGCALRADRAEPIAAAPEPAAGRGPDAGFAPPIVEAFHDLEGLIAIDPVHETNEAKGWPHPPPAQPAA